MRLFDPERGSHKPVTGEKREHLRLCEECKTVLVVSTRHSRNRIKPGIARPVIFVFISDDHTLFRDGLRSLLEVEDFKVIGEASSALDTLKQVPQLKPDVLLLDVRLRDLSGFD